MCQETAVTLDNTEDLEYCYMSMTFKVLSGQRSEKLLNFKVIP